MSDSNTMFVVMLRNGTYDDIRSLPIRTFLDGRYAASLADRKNLQASILMGKVEARDRMLAHWSETHSHHVEQEVQDREFSAERVRLNSILRIENDSKALGFENEYAMDYPVWSVVEVPHGAE